VQDTGVILGVSEAPPSVSFSEMSRLQQALASVIQQDAAVESLSSFIGVDGINTVMNSGRIQINLKPLAQRAGAGEIIRRLQDKLRSVEGITLYLQPVQDLSVEDRVSRTQFQYTLEDADSKELTVLDQPFTRKTRYARVLTRRRDRRTERRTGNHAGD
jgi:multidrug efflux pump